MSEPYVVLLKVVVEAPNLDQAVDACKGVADGAVQDVKIIDPEVVDSLSAFLPHLGIAIETAKIDYPDATIKLGVLAELPDGSGNVIARFDTAFVDDLRTLVDYNPDKEDPK